MKIKVNNKKLSKESINFLEELKKGGLMKAQGGTLLDLSGNNSTTFDIGSTWTTHAPPADSAVMKTFTVDQTSVLPQATDKSGSTTEPESSLNKAGTIGKAAMGVLALGASTVSFIESFGRAKRQRKAAAQSAKVHQDYMRESKFSDYVSTPYQVNFQDGGSVEAFLSSVNERTSARNLENIMMYNQSIARNQEVINNIRRERKSALNTMISSGIDLAGKALGVMKAGGQTDDLTGDSEEEMNITEKANAVNDIYSEDYQVVNVENIDSDFKQDLVVDDIMAKPEEDVAKMQLIGDLMKQEDPNVQEMMNYGLYGDGSDNRKVTPLEDTGDPTATNADLTPVSLGADKDLMRTWLNHNQGRAGAQNILNVAAGRAGKINRTNIAANLPDVDLSGLSDQEVAIAFINKYSKRFKHIQSSVDKAPSEIKNAIEKVAMENGINPSTMLTIAFQESSFNPTVLSQTGTYQGLFQINKNYLNKSITEYTPEQQAIMFVRHNQGKFKNGKLDYDL